MIETELRGPEGARGNLILLPELLKRTALAAWPREKVARIAGPDWIALLDASQKEEIGPTLSRFLKETEYRGGSAVSALSPRDAGNIVEDARRWIEGHHVPA
jgi:hypothetical protein